MSTTEHDRAAAARRRQSVDDSGEVPAVVPESDWSVDDDDLSGTASAQPSKQAGTNRGRSNDRASLGDTGQVPVVAKDHKPAPKSTPRQNKNRRNKKKPRQNQSTKKPAQSTSSNRGADPLLSGDSQADDANQTMSVPTQEPTQRVDAVPTPPVEYDKTLPLGEVPDRDEVTDAFDGPWGSQVQMQQPQQVPYGSPAPGMLVSDVDPNAPRRRRVRRVNRVLRHIDPWSTFKIGLLFNLVGYLVVMTAGKGLWEVADATGTLQNIERWFTQFGWETFEFNGSEIFRNAAIAGVFLAVGMTGALVMFATIFNLISDAIGGLRVSVLEEEVITIDDDGGVVVLPGSGSVAAGDWDVEEF